MAAVDLSIDEDGKVWSSHDIELRQRYGLIFATSDLPTYLVRFFGFIRLQFSPDQTGVRITIRDHGVAPQAVWEAIVVLSKYNGKRFVIDFLGSQPGFRVFLRVDEVIDLLVQHENTKIGTKRDLLFKHTLPISRLDTDSRLDHLRRQHQVWRYSWGNLDAARHNGVDFAGPNRNFLTRAAADSAEFVEMGRGFERNLVGLVSDSIGRLITDQPDARYGAWVGDSLMQTLHAATPRLELCEVTVTILGNKTVKRRYARIFLPWKSRFGDHVSSASVMLTDLITMPQTVGVCASR